MSAQSKHKSNVDQIHQLLRFGLGDQVFLRVSRFGRRGKLSPMYIGPYETLWIVVEWDVFLTFVEELVANLDRDVRQLNSRAIPVVKVRWRHRPVEEAIWETEHEM
ncbi:uncharacterized protein [Solanum tuberosum]|uniref:uncharacterized protein n=1 Tax=Solanum tuberosum TaxID=4113 RepID=UPI00073A26C0|nr:PREDICTED: uncharacterized protein LOC107059616 [Solanum tuberosum]